MFIPTVKYLSFDIRALSLMRMLMAGLIMADLGIRMTDLEAFYADTGVVPLNMLFEHGWNKYFISAHTISGLWQVQMVLFLAAFFFAAMLFIGYRTRLFTCLSWFMMLSLHNRNGLILQGGDDLLRMVLFWAMFIPWGARYSCDSILDPSEKPGKPIITAATIAYLLQVCYIYTGSALLKGPEWNSEFTAIYYAYSLDQVAYPITKHLYYHKDLLRHLTMLAYYFELLAPVLFFVPVKHAWFRTFGVFSIMLFHLINLCTLFIGLFPLIGIATITGMLPSPVMDWFDRTFATLKYTVAQSFTGFAALLANFIRWKKPVYVLSPIGDKIRTALLIFLTLFVFDWNFSNLSFINSKLSDNLRFIGFGLRLDQNWGMFAPGVFKDDGWYILEGIARNGEHFDLLHPGSKLSYAKPASITAMFKNDRWRKYSENYIFSTHQFMRGYFCNYMKRIWNEAHPDRPISRLRVIYMSEFTLPDYHYSLPKKEILCECWE